MSQRTLVRIPPGQRGLTHLQELIEQAEGISIGQLIVAQPVLPFADITRFDTAAFITTGLLVTPTTLPMQLIHGASAQAVLHPAGKQRKKERKLDGEYVPMHRAVLGGAVGARRRTHGTVNSKMLFRVCLRSMITDIWMNRSVKQPLGWHCKTRR